MEDPDSIGIEEVSQQKKDGTVVIHQGEAPLSPTFSRAISGSGNDDVPATLYLKVEFHNDNPPPEGIRVIPLDSNDTVTKAIRKIQTTCDLPAEKAVGLYDPSLKVYWQGPTLLREIPNIVSLEKVFYQNIQGKVPAIPLGSLPAADSSVSVADRRSRLKNKAAAPFQQWSDAFSEQIKKREQEKRREETLEKALDPSEKEEVKEALNKLGKNSPRANLVPVRTMSEKRIRTDDDLLLGDRKGGADISLKKVIQEKDQKLEAAGRIGKQLLDEKVALENEMAALKEWERDNAARTEEEMVGLRQQLAEFRAKCVYLEKQMREANDTNSKLIEELEQKERELNRSKVGASSDRDRMVQEQIEEIESLKKELLQKREEEEETRRSYTKLKIEKSKIEEKLALYELDINNLRSEAAAAAQLKERINNLNMKNKELQTRMKNDRRKSWTGSIRIETLSPEKMWDKLKAILANPRMLGEMSESEEGVFQKAEEILDLLRRHRDKAATSSEAPAISQTTAPSPIRQSSSGSASGPPSMLLDLIQILQKANPNPQNPPVGLIGLHPTMSSSSESLGNSGDDFVDTTDAQSALFIFGVVALSWLNKALARYQESSENFSREKKVLEDDLNDTAQRLDLEMKAKTKIEEKLQVLKLKTGGNSTLDSSTTADEVEDLGQALKKVESFSEAQMLQGEILNVRRRASDAEDEFKKREEQLKTELEEIKGEKYKLETQIEEMAKLEAEKACLEEEKKALENELEEAKEGHLSIVAAMEKQIEGLKEQRQNEQQQIISQLHEKSEEIYKMTSDREEELKKISSGKDQEIRTIQERLQAEISKGARKDEEIAKMLEDSSQVKRRLEKEISETKEKIAALELQIAQRDSQKEILEKKVSDLEAANSTLRAEKESEIKRIEQRLLANFEIEKQNLAAQRSEKESEYVRMAAGDLKNLEKERDSIRAEKEKVEKAMEVLKKENADILASRKTDSTDIVAMRTDMSKMRAERDQILQEKEKMTRNAQELELKLKKSREEYLTILENMKRKVNETSLTSTNSSFDQLESLKTEIDQYWEAIRVKGLRLASITEVAGDSPRSGDSDFDSLARLKKEILKECDRMVLPVVKDDSVLNLSRFQRVLLWIFVVAELLVLSLFFAAAFQPPLDYSYMKPT
eukprot:TRINITY_DN7668_c0_g1_i1.p1 TRINITY_DN7668_c0_g1~~TRINITY_DN7668_c0_g1_i1.p1  ORF type:complete len:1155 (-),score=403.56 TRINITY_DN7668_c0_g1_i1:101-3565(-)